MDHLSKDKRAEAVVTSAIVGLFGADAIDRVQVLPADDENGEPSLSVTVYLKAAQRRMSGSQLLDSISAAATELRAQEDFRFPYVTFLAPEDESAEDTRPAA